MQYECVPEDAGGNVASTTDGDHEIGLEVIEDLIRCILAELMDLQSWRVSVVFLRVFAEKEANRRASRRFECKVRKSKPRRCMGYSRGLLYMDRDGLVLMQTLNFAGRMPDSAPGCMTPQRYMAIPRDARACALCPCRKCNVQSTYLVIGDVDFLNHCRGLAVCASGRCRTEGFAGPGSCLRVEVRGSQKFFLMRWTNNVLRKR